MKNNKKNNPFNHSSVMNKTTHYIKSDMEMAGHHNNLRDFESFLEYRIDLKNIFKTPKDRWALPGWTYHNKELMDLEIKKVFRTHWQLICHVSDVPNVGDFFTDELLGDRVIVLRGNDNEVRVFYNVCRHRGSMVVEAERGNCGKILTCPFHGWTYHLDGSLMGVAQKGAYDDIDKKDFSLRQVETEIWKGFVFIRFDKGPQPSIAEIMAPYENLFAPYRVAEITPLKDSDIQLGYATLNANWKSARDVDNEGYHVAKVHTYLRDLYGKSYSEDPYNERGISLARGIFLDTKEREHQLWACRAYRSALKRAKSIPEKTKDVWFYVGLFPNTVIQLYPEGVSFYQDIPIRPDFCKQRYGYYVTPNVDAQSQKYVDLAAKTARRIDQVTYEEDRALSIWSFEGQKSVAFPGAYLSNFEGNVKAFQTILKKFLPVMDLPEEPEGQDLAELNRQLLTQVK